jgi:hypothetical protein
MQHCRGENRKRRLPHEIERKLKDVKCGYKDTSCAGQLAKAVREAKNAEKK